MNNKFIMLCIVCITIITSNAQELRKLENRINSNHLALKVSKNASWWVGIINHGNLMPLQQDYHANMDGNNYSNQIQPLLLSKDGEVIWSEDPLEINYTKDSLIVDSKSKEVIYTRAGMNLKEAYQFASKQYFSFKGKTPDKLLFSNPQYNTWIELMYNQNETDILKYAKSIIDNGFTPGVLMVDDNWQEDYGSWQFHPGRFQSPKEMVNKLHKMGFKVMLWVCPFISADSKNGRDVVKRKLVLLNNQNEPALVKWWNGYSLLLDFSNPQSVNWFKNSLDYLEKEYGVDGFKFDAGDANSYMGNIVPFKPNTTANDQTALYANIGLDYPLNEYRAIWKMGGQPLANRLADKGHNWNDLQYLIPNMILEGLMGYAFSCPDMIGGGEFTSFQNNSKIDQDLIVRSAQCHALMPMMQFSVAPWRILDKTHLDAVLKAVKLREKFKSYILASVNEAAKAGVPILRSLEYEFPHNGYENIKDQFIIGDSLLVAPILEKNANSRKIVVPKGEWENEIGEIIIGPKIIKVNTGLDVLPYLKKINK